MHYKDEDFIDIWNSSRTIAEVGRRLGLRPSLWYKQITKCANRLGLGREHMVGRSHGTSGRAKPIEEYLVEGSTASSSNLKRRLIKEGLLLNECAACGISVWQGVQLVLHLDHIDGVHNNNVLSNLRLLCPNCHSMTPTYGGRNKSVGRLDHHPWMHSICGCGDRMSSGATKCVKCYRQSKRKICLTDKGGETHTAQEVLDMVLAEPYTRVSHKLGVGDNTIRKFLISNGLTPPRKYPNGVTRI